MANGLGILPHYCRANPGRCCVNKVPVFGEEMTFWITKSKNHLIASILVLNMAVVPLGGEKAYSATNEIPLLDEPRALPDIEFFDESNNPVSLDNWLGKVVLLNIWATWCGPCRTEMPTLDRLQEKLGSDQFEVVALSIDEAGLGVVKKFFEQINVKNLDIYIDPTYQSAGKLQALGLPATILIDPKGQELGRLVGPAEWDTPELISFFKRVVSEQF